jgi:uncharacterized alkaline shock family protein YloU
MAAGLVCDIKNELGTISITEDVLAIIAGYSAVECAGIVAMASKRATDGIVEMLGRENFRRGIRIGISENKVTVDLFIIVEYGVSIAAVARTAIETVKYRLESAVGVEVARVNVTVEGIRV